MDPTDLKILIDDEFWMAAQSPPHIPIGIQPSPSLLIPLSSPGKPSSVWPEFHIPFSRDLYLRRGDERGSREGERENTFDGYYLY